MTPPATVTTHEPLAAFPTERDLASLPQSARPARDAPRDWVLSVSHEPGGRPTIDGLGTVTLGPFTLAFAGVLSNHDDLADATLSPPSASSAQVALALVAEKGPAAFSDLRGGFIVALVDTARGVVHVARDPLGSHPLFYVRTSYAVLFAATPQPLLARPGVSRALNRAALADHLAKRWPERQETFFKAIRRVPPGWEVTVAGEAVRASRYWHPVSAEIDYLPDEEADAFDHLLDRAVDRALRPSTRLGAGRAGIFLSGGFDSVSVAAVAADRASHLRTATPVGLSLAFPDPECDERLVQTRVAQTLGLPLHIVDFQEAAGKRGLLAEAIDLNADLAAPLFNTWAPAYLALIRQARRLNIDTILTGEGGDEWLGVTPFLAADLLKTGRLLSLARMALANHRSYHQNAAQVIGTTLWRYGMRPLAGLAFHKLAPKAWDHRRATKMMRSSPAWLAPDAQLRRRQYERTLQSLAPADPPGGFYSRESQVFLDHPLTSWLFEEQHQFGQQAGIRYVHPYWDADLLVHVYRVRPERLNQGGRSKGLVRQTVARRFPALGFERQRKVTALNFFSSIVRAEAPPIAETYSDFRALASLGIVEPAGARAFSRAAWHQTYRELGYAWNLVNLEAWVRTRA